MHPRRISAYGILDINRDTEVLNQFVLTAIEEPFEKQPIEGDQKSPLKTPHQKRYGIIKHGVSRKAKDEKRVDFDLKKVEVKQNQNLETKSNSQDEKTEEGKDEVVLSTEEKLEEEQKLKIKFDPKKIKEELKKKRKKRKRPKPEELYTDKDRAAAVNMGTRDIKQSLKIKRRQDRFKNLQVSEEAEPTTLLALGNFEMKKGEEEIALRFLHKALELNPTDKNCLVARSKCYILLGQPENGLKDAEAALAVDKNFMKAIFQKAESLYYLGDFEHSLMYHYRGLRIRPDYEGFQLGIRKTQKAIENAIGGALLPVKKKSSVLSSTAKNSDRSRTKEAATTTSSKISTMMNTPESKIVSDTPKSTQRSTPMMRPITAINRNSKLLRELKTDKEYLDSLLTRPDLKCKNKEDDSAVMGYIKDAVDFLNTRQEFWRQQLPTNFNK